MRESDLRETGDVTYDVLTELSAINAIAEEWNSLLDRSDCNLAFSSAQWFIATCRVHSQMTPHVIVARRRDEIVGILPLVSDDNGSSAKFPSFLSDYNDIIVAPEDSPVAVGLVLDCAAAKGQRGIVLSNLRPDSQCLRAVRALETARWLDCVIKQDRTCYYLTLASTYDDYLKTRSRVFRKSLGRAWREAQKYNVSVRELDPETFSCDQLPKIFLSLNYDRFGMESHFGSTAAQAFVREVFPSLFGQRRLRAFALFDADRMIGIDICMAGARSLCTWNGGFAAEARRWSPGRLLISEGIRRGYELKLDEYDFLRGSHDYKAKWASGTRVLSQCVLLLGD
jgi:CelD/BcsL family acetyltransferase involved in cellulose biosynthesis